MENRHIINLTFGILLLKIITKCMKKILKKNRPNGLKGGMPSFMGALTLYISTYLYLNSNNLSIESLLSIIIFIIGSLSIKYYMKEHTLSQLIVGGIIGILFAKIINFVN